MASITSRKKTVLVTGANKGIGYCIVEHLLLHDFFVVAVSRNDDNLVALKSTYTNQLVVLKADLQFSSDIQNVFNFLAKEKIDIDVLINNAGIGIFENVENLSVSDWTSVINLNLNVPFYLINHFLPFMKSHNYGRIINISSNADSISEAKGSAYCASKHGLLALSQCVQLETKGYNISVTTISPGRVDTYFNNKTPGARPFALQPSDVAEAVLYVLNVDSRCNIEQIKIQSILE